MRKLRSKHIMKKPLVLREMERVGLRVCVCVCVQIDVKRLKGKKRIKKREGMEFGSYQSGKNKMPMLRGLIILILIT